MVWYTFIAFYPLILLGFLYYLINFYNLGEISRNERVLNGESYIIKDNEKYFGIVCGKENCIFQTKDFSKNLSLKDNSIKNNKLQPTKTYNLTNQNSIFSAFEIEQVKNKNYIIYLYQITPKQDLNKNDLKDHLSLFSKKGVVYRPIVNQKVILLSSLSDKPNLPVFLAFKLPLNDQVDFIFNHKIPYKLSLKN
ncbi:hypothetical protein PJ15_0866 [Acinetobacter sp. neg1]|uniref:hypothetical protein n=1 Tax=Acinetobacter TaxID=469 RepID=UPI0005424EBB|nr:MULTISPECIES: hypothetical protein [Acinetobacter]KHF77810.1 hypothetical protein PJ15_0866 [Acinetobacter sp. neg1]MBJ8481940.1 hypothetical protein [Acinetobacter vivianii]